jgi:hypothetical protein
VRLTHATLRLGRRIVAAAEMRALSGGEDITEFADRISLSARIASAHWPADWKPVATLLKSFCKEPLVSVKLATIAIEMIAAISAYSIAVAPSSSVTNAVRLNRVIGYLNSGRRKISILKYSSAASSVTGAPAVGNSITAQRGLCHFKKSTPELLSGRAL